MKIFQRNIEKKQSNSIELIKRIKDRPLPVHIGIIMDGNGRWAKKRSLPRTAGHRAGMESFKRIVKAAVQVGVPYLTVYAFSTENWKRPREEVDALMGLLVEYIKRELSELKSQGVRIKTLGQLDALPQKAQLEIVRAERETVDNKQLYLQIALNYGGRMELTKAVREICHKVALSEIKWENIDEELIGNYLYTANIPDPDLIIRTSGEYRLSNFLIWQAAYAEIVITDVLWPDFMPDDFFSAIDEYQHRQRRFGGI